MTSNGNSRFFVPGISKRTMERRTLRRRQSSAYVSCVESWNYSSSRNRGYESEGEVPKGSKMEPDRNRVRHKNP